MIKKWLSSYNLNYPRSIVYMLQASEYKIPAYLKWFKRVESFHNIEIRKHFVKTKKSILLLLIAWGMIIITCVFAVFILSMPLFQIKYFMFLFTLVLTPYILAFGITIPLLLVKFFVQSPVEYFIIKNAHKKLQKHKGIKIGIAGSYGKTTMREILKSVLLEGKKVAAPPHNHNTLLGISNFIKNLKGDEEVLIFEFGEYYRGDIKEMCELVNPELGIITGINEAHLEKFKSLDNTISTIFELSDWLHGKTVYANGENKLVKENALKEHIVYTKNGLENWKVENPSTDLTGTSFSLIHQGRKFEFKSKLLGLHQIGPLVVAIDIAVRLNIPMNKIQKGVENTRPFDHRLEPKLDAGGVTIIDDSYNGNPDGVKVIIEFLASLRGHRRFYITPGLVEIGSRTEIVHREIGKNLAKAKIEKVILVRNSVTPYIEQGLKESDYKGEVIWFNDSLSLFTALPHLTVSGDVVLLQNDWPDQYY
jgi:UDP-N-acetylmuramoyl-tripeptide--D-alanyl-D-alanine ligase